jgi:DNA polymerase III subunit alpha
MIDIREKLINICIKSMQIKNCNSEIYKSRLKKELQETDNQADHEYFINLYEKKAKFSNNENNLFIAYLLDLCDDFDISKEPKYVQGEFPDIDVDYLPIIQDYLRNDYCPRAFGRDKVVNIGNYGTFGMKSALLDMARVHSADRNEIQSITKNLQDRDEEGNPLTWEKALELSPELSEYSKKYPEVTDSARRLIDRNRSRGKHAGGTVISSVKIDDFVPVMIDTDGNPVSGWTEGLHDQDLQPVGLIKFDVLAIKDLLRIANCCKLIKERYNIKSISALEGCSDWSDTSYLNDSKSLALANESKTRGVFQFDSEGMRNLIKSGGVDSFDDLVAYTALFRPSALKMQMHERYIERKKGREKWEDQVPECVIEVLKNTQGVFCVHEDTIVSMYDGTEKKISQVNAGDIVHTYNEKTKEFEPKKVKWSGFTKKDNGKLIKLKNGFEIITTDDHKILTYEGWKEAKDLAAGDLIAVPKKLSKNKSNLKTAEWLGKNEDVSYLLGLLVGDGSTSQSGCVLSTGTKQNHLLIKKHLVEKFKKLIIRDYFHCRSWYISIKTKILANNSKCGNRKTKFNLLLDDLGMRQTCYAKTVPSLIMKSSKVVRSSFLAAGLFDADGTFKKYKDGVLCAYTSVSKLLLNDLRKLLLLEGIQSHYYTNKIYIWNTKKFSKIINNYSIIKKIEGKLRSGNKSHKIPRKFLFEYLKSNKFTKRGLERDNGISRQHFNNDKPKNISFSVVEKITPESNLLFFEVENISEIKNKNFHDISVEDNHNFVGNGIVVHNCYQEQCMQVLNVVGDIPLIHCEKIRKAISKKKISEFAKYKQMFLENGSRKTGWPIESDDNKNMNFLFNQIEAFSGYGFNKSHACAYTHLSSRLLYLKAHYPLEFFVSTLSLESDEDKLKSYKREAERLNIKINRCDLNKSKGNFEIVDNEIYIGFSNIKGIGKEVAEEIVSKQPFSGIEDFLKRFGTDKRIVEPLIYLEVFKERPIHILLEFYEEFKKWDKSNVSKIKAQEKRRSLLIEEMKGLLKNHDILIHENLMNLYENFDNFEQSYLLEEFSKEDFYQILRKYWKSVTSYEQKSELLEQNFISLENWECKNTHTADEIPNQFDIEKKYYGFSWQHPLEKSPDYKGDLSFTRFKEDEMIYNAGVECVITKKPEEKISKNGNKYYYVLVEDEDWNVEVVTFWEEDYNRFKEELNYWNCEENRGNLIQMRVVKPGKGFRSYTFESPRKQERYKLPQDKSKDHRLQVMEAPAKRGENE